MSPAKAFEKVPQALIRHLIGDEVADLLGVEATSWQKALAPVHWANRLMDQTLEHTPIISRAASIGFRQIMKSLMLYNLGGQRSAFHIPSALQQQWRILETGNALE
jgi:hypothetical protein